MAAIRHKIVGRLLTSGDQTWLIWLDRAALDAPFIVSHTLFLRYALVERGTEQPIFPELALDDWGHERTGLELYRWVEAEGDLFPRAELFGYTWHGQPIQRFLREIELGFLFPCYIYSDPAAALDAGRRLDAIILPDDTLTQTEPASPPAAFPLALRRAHVSWWRAPHAALEATTFSLPSIT